MIKPICKDTFLLSQKSTPATKGDINVMVDLQDTLKANENECVGMAANMIGVNKCIIIFNAGSENIIMVNPNITKHFGSYEAEEGCLSLVGKRKTTRYELIEVEFYDVNFKKQNQKFNGFTAQIIQHEIDHCNGILI